MHMQTKINKKYIYYDITIFFCILHYFTLLCYLLWGSILCIIWKAGERAGEQVTDNYCALVISNGFHLT